MKTLFAALVFLVTMLIGSHSFAANDFKIITLQHRFAEDLLPTIQPIVGNEGTVSGIQNQLIIRTTPERMAEIEQLVATLDVERQNLRITVSHQNNLQSQNRDISVQGKKRIGNVEIGTTRFPRNSREGVQIGLDDSQNSSISSGNQFINVSDGGSAFIKVGQAVPFTQEWITLTRRYTTVQRTTDFVDVSTGFAVRPRSIGNQVELEITPRIAKLNQSGMIDFQELSTVVTVSKGEWIDIGGIMQQKDDVSRAILSRQSGSQSQNNQLSIRVD
ncbi:MAG TPA: secretin N-terminal domain-containing protein [Methylotenera sp.]|nr:secretin N-terminal domain-containing protein [Methylotenera sp.]